MENQITPDLLSLADAVFADLTEQLMLPNEGTIVNRYHAAAEDGIKFYETDKIICWSEMLGGVEVTVAFEAEVKIIREYEIFDEYGNGYKTYDTRGTIKCTGVTCKLEDFPVQKFIEHVNSVLN